jgi:tetratricopeptide (TPR) repeat protein
MMETARKRPRSPTRFDDVYQTLDQSDIKRLDPENAMIRNWELEIGEDREKYQRLEESRKLASERSEMAAAKLREVEPFRKAVADASDPIEKLRRLKTLHSELEEVRDALPRDSDDLDKEVSVQNRKVWKVIEIIEQDIVSCRKSLDDFMASHLEDAKGVERAAEASGNPEDYNKAFTRWSKVSEIESELELAWLGHKSTEELKPQGKLGMSRIRGVLNDRAKALYTEAILAESYSDFAKAREKFEDLLRIAPSDDQSVDSYFARARRKLTVYSQFDKALGKERMPAADPTAGTATDSPPAPDVLNAEPVPDTSEVPAAQPVEVSPAVPSSADAGGTGP